MTRLRRHFRAAALVVLTTLGVEARANPVADLVTQLEACDGLAPPLRLVVAGLPNDQTALSPLQATQLRRDVEGLLQAANTVDIAAARDVSQLRALTESGTVPAATDVESLLSTANAGDAVIFIVDPVRSTQEVSFRLQALTPDARCKVTSGVVTAGLTDTGAASIDRIVDTALSDFLTTAPDIDALGICPVVTEGGYSTCGPALTESLVAAATAQAQSAARVLTDRPLDVTRLTAMACAETGGVRTSARLSSDNSGQSWLGLDVRDGDRVLTAIPRTRVDVAPLGCDVTPRPLLDFISLTANRDRAALDITAPVFRTGTLLDVAIQINTRGPLYCWVIAPDESAFIVLPAGEAADVAPGTYGYPQDFGLNSVVLSAAFENLFHCFAPGSALPADLANRWQALGPTGAQAGLLDQMTINALLDQMRAQPDMIEATARLVVRD